MIIYAELYHQDGAHVPFNSGMLEIIRLAFPDDEIMFFAPQSHLEQVRSQVGPRVASSIGWKPIVPPAQNANYFSRLRSDIEMVNHLATSLGQETNSRLVLTSISSSSLLAVKLMQRLTRKKVRVQVISHGEIMSGIGQRHRHPWRRFKEMRTALTLLKSSSIQYLVLEQSIRERLLQTLPSLGPNVEVLEHPIPANEGNSSVKQLATPVQFGFLGRANEVKGFPMFVELAAEMARSHPDKAQFHTVGRLESGSNSIPGLQALATPPAVERMSRNEYIDRLKRLHFIVMPYRIDYYELSPSGTLLDALAWGIPIIAAKIPIFARMFEAYGDIGYLFNNESELLRIVGNIIEERNDSRYAGQAANVHKARVSRSPATLARLYREICNRGSYLSQASHSQPILVKKSAL
jgi:glycosyltransferase involved in cell wall biosynthesis